MPSRTTLTAPVQSLLSSLSNNAGSSQLQSHFTTDPPPQIHEHGLPLFAPFLGRTFSGIDGVARYFDLLARYLEFQNVSFENEDGWIVDEISMAVFLRGTSRFLWKETGETWDETFCYRIALAEDMEEKEKRLLKVQEYRVWGDTGALYLASRGKLGEVSREAGATAGAATTTAMTGETRRGIDRKKSGCGEVVGSGMNVYGSCGG